MASIPSEITVPVKVRPKVSVGVATYLGAAGAASGLSGAVLAFLLGDHSPETQTAIVSGAAVGLGSLLATVVGRYAQAHATIARAGADLLGPSVTAINQHMEPMSLEAVRSLGEAATAGLDMRRGGPIAGTTLRVDDRLARFEGLLERILDHVEPQDKYDDEGEAEPYDDEDEPAPLDAIADPPPLNTPATIPDGEPAGPELGERRAADPADQGDAPGTGAP